MRACATGLVALAACQFGSSGGTSSAGLLPAGSDDGSGSVPAGETSTDGGDTQVGGDATGNAATGSSSPITTPVTTVDGDASSTGSGDATSSGEDTASPLPACDRALMVTGDTNVAGNADTPLYDRLVAEGFVVTVVNKAESVPEDVADNCVVIISDLGSSEDANTKFRDVTVGVVVVEPGLFDDMLLVDQESDAWWGEGYDDITIVDPGHSLAAGMADTVSIWDGGGRGTWGNPVASAQVVAVWPPDHSHATLFGYEAGAEMGQAFVAPARRVAFPGGHAPVPMTPERVDLFEAAVRWAAGDLP